MTNPTPKDHPHPHEINVLKNTIEKAVSIGSERLVEWAHETIKKIEAEYQRLAPKKANPLLSNPAAQPPVKTSAPGVAAPAAVSTAPASEPVADHDEEDHDEEGGEAMTIDEMRATGHYTEDEIKAAAEANGVEYTAPEANASDAPHADESNPATAAG